MNRILEVLRGIHWGKVLRTLGLGILAVVLTQAIDLVSGLDLGAYKPMIIALLTALLESIRRAVVVSKM